jgi:4-amino-4-deoxy-L-arabinose transferase-like glycosyltransferase
MQAGTAPDAPRRVCGLPLAAWGILLLTVALSLFWSHIRLLYMDEFLTLYTDSLPTFHDVLNVQLHRPVGAEPPAFHFLTHASLDLFGHNAVALRLPSLPGFLLFQVCLYLFVERFAGRRSGLIAMSLALITSTVGRSLEAKPYGILMGLFALAVVAWQLAARAEGHPRLPSLLVLWLAVAGSISIHYYGVLVLVPICGAELARALLRRHVDWGMAVSLLLGAAAAVLDLPFLPAISVYRQHANALPAFNGRFVMEVYRVVLLDNRSPLSHPWQLLFLGTLVLAIATGLYARRPAQADLPQEWVALALLGLLPLFGIMMAATVTHVLAPRYFLLAAFLLPACGGIAVQTWVRKRAVFYGLFALLLVAGVTVNLWNIVQDCNAAQRMLASCEPSGDVKSVLQQNPGERIYVQTFSQYALFSYYAPDPAVRSRLTLLTDSQQLRYEGIDTFYVFTQNLRRFAPFPVVPYEEFLRLHHPLVLYYTSSGDGDVWLDRDLRARGRTVRTVGPWMEGYLAQVDDRP